VSHPGPSSHLGRAAATITPVVFLVDVDNTLLDNDQIIDDLRNHLATTVGTACRDRYWAIFEENRDQLGYADYLGALQRYRLEAPDDVRVLEVSSFLLDYPFAERLFPRALDVLSHLARSGPTVILSDGDVVFQPWKIERSGLRDAVAGRVLVYIHKEQRLADVERRFPAAHYVFVDDKVRLLTAFKEIWGERVTTVFPRQGHYATDPSVASYPAPDLTVERIADLLRWSSPAR
jgi:FMN phosphatase YigB (HAD superfamily)